MKTNKIFTFLILIAIVFGNTHCNTSDYSKEITEVESLLASAEKLNQYILKIDSATIMEQSKIVNADFLFVQDSLPAELFLKADFFLTRLKTVKKMMGGFSEEYRILKKETQYSIDQLIDLKADLENGSLTEADTKKYIQEESRAIVVLDQQYKKLEMGLDILNDQYFVYRTSFYTLYREYRASL
jgi:hypothetical protein